MASIDRRFTLLFRGFSESFSQVVPEPRLPQFETLLARADRMAAADASYEQRLCTIFGIDTDGELPIGAVRRVGEGAAIERGWWYCAEPVHFLVSRDRVHLIAGQTLSVTSDEAQSLAASFNNHFAADGWFLETPCPERWYLRAPGPQAVRTVPLSLAVSRDMGKALPSGPDALFWHRFLNEMQMLFHGSEVNGIRERRGLPAINGFWPWGGGALPTLQPLLDEVWSDEPLSRGFASLSGAKVGTPQVGFPGKGDNALLVLSAHGESAWWREGEERWFAPLRQALAAGALENLCIEGIGEGLFHLSRRNLRGRWWRRRRPVSRQL